MSKFNNGEKIPEPKLNMAGLEAMMNRNLATRAETEQLGAITNSNPTSAQNN